MYHPCFIPVHDFILKFNTSRRRNKSGFIESQFDTHYPAREGAVGNGAGTRRRDQRTLHALASFSIVCKLDKVNNIRGKGHIKSQI